MTDIKLELTSAVASIDEAPSAQTVEADLSRGRAALAQRRRGRAIRLVVAAPVVVAALVGTAVLVGGDGENVMAPSTGRHVGSHSGAVNGQSAPVSLVAYEGDQVKGFVVDQVPEGWTLQGSNPFRLTIAPEGDTTSPDDFVGKLVVTLLSSSAPQRLPQGEPVQVGGQDGVVSHQGDADTLTYEDSAGHLVQVQAWHSALGWSNEQLARFAEGVQVTADAQAGVG